MNNITAFLVRSGAVCLLLFISACSAPQSVPPAGPLPSPTDSLTPQATPGEPTQRATPSSKDKRPTKAASRPTLPAQNTPGAKTKGKNPDVAPTSGNPAFLAAEIFGRTEDTSIVANVVPAAAMSIYYEYGTVTGSYSAQTAPQAAAAGAPLETEIRGLLPDTRYFIRLRYGDQMGPEHTFVTQRAPGSAFTFDIQGDSHPERVGNQFDAALYTRTLQAAAADQPDFYMTIGDDFSVDTLKDVNAQTVRAIYLNQRQWLGLVGAPLFLVNGNHEQAALANLNGTPDNVAVWAQTSRNSLYPQPAPDSFYSGDTEAVDSIGLLRDYYAYTWGDALFVVIDPYWHSPQAVDNTFGSDQKGKRDLWGITLGDTQYQWFKQTLENSSARYKFVFTHHVSGTGRGGIELAKSYEWGDAVGLAAHRPGWDKTIHQLMVDNHVSIFFQGHDHIFVRQELDGVIYQTLPEPANPNETYENRAAYLSGDQFPNSGYVRVNVSSSGVKVEYIRTFLDRPTQIDFSYTLP